MDYWASNIWLFVLCLWVAFLVFSPDRRSAKIAAVWLVSYCFVAPIVDTIYPLLDNRQTIQTICGLIGAGASYYAFKCAAIWLSRVLALAAICHFVYFVVLLAGSDIGNYLFFGTFYLIEVSVVALSLGIVNYVDRVNSSGCDSVGRGFYGDGSDDK